MDKEMQINGHRLSSDLGFTNKFYKVNFKFLDKILKKKRVLT